MSKSKRDEDSTGNYNNLLNNKEYVEGVFCMVVAFGIVFGSEGCRWQCGWRAVGGGVRCVELRCGETCQRTTGAGDD